MSTLNSRIILNTCQYNELHMVSHNSRTHESSLIKKSSLKLERAHSRPDLFSYCENIENPTNHSGGVSPPETPL